MKKELYRIKQGEIKNRVQTVIITFGIVYEIDGVIYFDLYVDDPGVGPFGIIQLRDDIELFELSAETVDLDLLEATGLHEYASNSESRLITMFSAGHIAHTDMRLLRNQRKQSAPLYNLFYLEFEGLIMSFCDRTVTTTERQGVVQLSIDDGKYDHTNVRLNFQLDLETLVQPSSIVFNKHPVNDTIVVSFPGSRTLNDNKREIPVSYEEYKKFKLDFVQCLSLLNGADVLVRREYIGGYVQTNGLGAQTVVTYSTRTIKHESSNFYVPLRNDNYGYNILSSTLHFCFPSFRIENQKLDLNSIIFYLNGAEQAKSLQEKFFILIIAFERLALKYVQSIEDNDLLIIPNDVYAPIKRELLDVLKRNEDAIGKKVNTLSGLIGELNKIKKTSTQYKFVKLLERAQIEITPAINHIIQEARHVAIHQGEIGVGNQAFSNYITLDTLLRDIILNIIGYKSRRMFSKE